MEEKEKNKNRIKENMAWRAVLPVSSVILSFAILIYGFGFIIRSAVIMAVGFLPSVLITAYLYCRAVKDRRMYTGPDIRRPGKCAVFSYAMKKLSILYLDLTAAYFTVFVLLAVFYPSATVLFTVFFFSALFSMALFACFIILGIAGLAADRLVTGKTGAHTPGA